MSEEDWEHMLAYLKLIKGAFVKASTVEDPSEPADADGERA
jgi:hypothetical protein